MLPDEEIEYAKRLKEDRDVITWAKTTIENQDRQILALKAELAARTSDRLISPKSESTLGS